LLVQIFSTPGETAMDLASDVVTEDLCSIFASVSAGDMSGMKSLAENEQANEYVRVAALRGLVTLVACGQRRRDEVVAYLQGLFDTLERRQCLVWSGLATSCLDLYAVDSKGDLRKAFDEELIEPLFARWDHAEKCFEAGEKAAMERLKKRYGLIDDVEKAMG
jgi:hypothetical protein